MMRKFLRLISLFALIPFSLNQTVWAADLSTLLQAPEQAQTKGVSLDEKKVLPAPVEKDIWDTSSAFLDETLQLEKVSDAKSEAAPFSDPNKKAQDDKSQLKDLSESRIANKANEGYEFERYSMEEALENLRPEYASALVLENLKASDMKSLIKLGFEVSILVISGEIVLLTSGSEDEIAVSPAAQKLIQQAAFISHTHPLEFSSEGPSGQDLNEAVEAPAQEFVVTARGAYAYNREGISNDGNPYSYEYFVDSLKDALEASSHEKNLTEARASLNEFIAEQDLLNQNKALAETFRRGGTFSSNPSLNASSVTTLPGNPFPYLMSGSSSSTSLGVISGNRFQLNYNVTQAGSKSGMTISFDNASTTAIETRNLSALQFLTFGLQGTASALRVQLVDAAGHTDTVTLTNLTNAAEKFWRFPMAVISNTVNKAQIRQINLYVDQAATTAQTRTGNVKIRIYGLNTSAPAKPVVTSQVPQATNQTSLTLTGTKEANTAVFINGVQAVPLNGATTWSAVINLSVEGNNTFNLQTKNSIGLLSQTKQIVVLRDTQVPAGAALINSGAAATNNRDVVLNLNVTDQGSGLDQMRFSTDGGISWSEWEVFSSQKNFHMSAGDGVKIILAQVKDKVGNVASYSDEITLDTVPPAVTAISAAQHAEFDAPFVIVTYSVTENGQTVQKTAEWNLQEGENDFVITETDLAGNQTQVTRHVIYHSPEASLTAEEKSLRKNLIQANSSYFHEGVGIDAASGLPLDWIGEDPAAQTLRTQPTSIGFYLQFLSDVITKRITLNDFTQAQALQAADKALTTLLQIQQSHGWNGLIPWMHLSPLQPETTRIALGDNANLSQSLAVFIGAIESSNAQVTFAQGIHTKAKLFLANQSQGYQNFYDPAEQKFFLSYDKGTSSFSWEHMNRLGNEFRAAIAFIIENYGLPESAWKGLEATIRYYSTRQGRVIETLSPYEGSAFQMFWPLLRAPEHQLPQIREALENSLSIYADFMRRKGLAGFPSASSIPGGGYDGYIGIQWLQENPTLVREDIGSVYALAAAYRIDPKFVLGLLNEIQQAFPDLTGPNGFYDSRHQNGLVSRNYLAIDQGSIVVGLLGNGPAAFQKYMENRGLWAGYKGLYQNLDLNLTGVPPEEAAKPLSRADQFARTPDSASLYDFLYDYDQAGSGDITVTKTSEGNYRYVNAGNFGWIGGFVSPVFNAARYRYLTLEVRNSPAGAEGASFDFEVKQGTRLLLPHTRQTLQTGDGWQTLTFFLPEDFSSVEFIAFSNLTAPIEVRNLHFKDQPIFPGTFPPVIELVSPAASAAPDYELVYKLNGELHTEKTKLQNGANSIRRVFGDEFGRSYVHIFNVTYAPAAPAGKILINSGASETDSLTVQLSNLAENTGSGIAQMQFSTDGVNFSAPETFNAAKTWVFTGAAGEKKIWAKFSNSLGQWSEAFQASIQYAPAKTLENFNGTSHGFFWDSDGTAVYTRDFPTEGPNGSTAMRVNFTKHAGLEYSFFAFQPFHNGSDNNFTGAKSFRFDFKKTSLNPLGLLVKFEFGDGSAPYEKFIAFPQSANSWQEVAVDISHFTASQLANLQNVFFFADPGLASGSGSFLMDNLHLDVKPVSKTLDDFEGNSSIATYFDGDGTAVYQRGITNSQAHSGANSMRVDYQKNPAMDFSFFAFQPDSLARDISEYNAFRMVVKKTSAAPLHLSMKMDFEGTTYQIESHEMFPAGAGDWALVQFNFPAVPDAILKKLRNVYLFADPMHGDTSGTFYIDDLEWVLDPGLPAQVYNAAPSIGMPNIMVGNDMDGVYQIGTLIWIHAPEDHAAFDLSEMTVRVFSKSTGYDSGAQKIPFNHDGGFWPYAMNTQGLLPADDYSVIYTIKDIKGQETVMGDYDNPAAVFSLVYGPPPVGETFRAQNFSLPTPAGNFSFDFSHDLQGIAPNVLGPTWRSSFDQYVLEFLDGHITVNQGMEKSRFFYKDPDQSYRSGGPSDYGVMTKLAGGGFTIREQDGTLKEYTSVPDYDDNTQMIQWKLTRVTDPNGNATNYIYDANKNLVQVGLSSGDVIRLEYAAPITGIYQLLNYYPLKKVIDPAGREWNFTQNAGGIMTEVADPLGQVMSFVYDAKTRLTAVTLPDAVQETYSYDTAGRLETVSRAGVLQSRFVYGGVNDTSVKQIDSLGREITQVFSPEGFLLESTDAAGVKTFFNYDAAGNLLKRIDDAGGQNLETRYRYDHQTNLIFSEDPLGNISRYTYENQFNQLTSSLDAENNLTRYEYDSRGNLTRELYADGAIVENTYDAGGKLLTRKDGRGNLTHYAYNTRGLLESVTHALGGVTHFEYDAAGNLTKQIDALGRETRNEYDALSRLTRQIDAQGNITGYFYDALGRLTSQVDALGNLTQYQYDLLGRLIRTTNALGEAMLYSYDTKGNLLSETDPLGRAMTYEYNSRDERTKSTDRNGNVTRYEYDALYRLVKTIDALGGITLFNYDAAGRLISQTDSLGHIDRFFYDSLGRLTMKEDALGNRVFYGYDSLGRVIKFSDEKGRKTQSVYDKAGNLIQTTDALGQSASFVYDALNRLVSETDVVGAVTSYAYDTVGNQTSVTDALGRATLFEYDSLNRRIKTTDALGRITRFDYDALGRQTRVTDALGNITSFGYDSLGRLVLTTNPDGSITRREYDHAGDLTATVDELGRRSEFSYDANHNLTASKDALGFITQYFYDALNRKTSERDARGVLTQYEFNLLGDLLTITDGRGSQTRYEYDALGRQVKAIYADGSFETTAYDEAGNIVKEIDRKGQVKRYVHDSLNRLVRAYLPDDTELRSYDAAGRLVRHEKDAGVMTYGYDLLGRLTQETDIYGNPITHTYDAVGNETSLSVTIGGTTLTRSYAYDALDRLITQTDEKNRVTSYQYDSRSRVVKKTLPNGASTETDYNAASEVTEIRHKTLGGNIFRTITNTFDGRGDITQKQDSLVGLISYVYDEIGQLVSMTHPVMGLVVYALDQLGNRDSVTKNGVVEDYTANSLNEYTSAGNAVQQYDLNGNLISKSENGITTSYVYDSSNRLRKVTTGSSVTEFVYDPSGRRVAKIVNGVITRYVWDGDQLVAETTGSGQILREYGYGIDIDEPLYQETYSTHETVFFHQDFQYSTVALTDSSGSLKESYDYDAFGQLISAKNAANQTVTPAVKLLYTGREFDSETGLHYYRNRYYDAKQGRFISTDPTGYADGLNLYTYAQNRPTMGRDPQGLAFETLWQFIDWVLYLNSAGQPLPEIRPAPKPSRKKPKGNREREILEKALQAISPYVERAVLGAQERLPGPGGLNNPTNPGGPIGGGGASPEGVPAGGATAPFPTGSGSKTGPLSGGAKQAKQSTPPPAKKEQDAGNQKTENKKKGGSEHTKGARPSTLEKHERGLGRKTSDKPGGEKGDFRRPFRRGGKGSKYAR